MSALIINPRWNLLRRGVGSSESVSRLVWLKKAHLGSLGSTCQVCLSCRARTWEPHQRRRYSPIWVWSSSPPRRGTPEGLLGPPRTVICPFQVPNGKSQPGKGVWPPAQAQPLLCVWNLAASLSGWGAASQQRVFTGLRCSLVKPLMKSCFVWLEPSVCGGAWRGKKRSSHGFIQFRLKKKKDANHIFVFKAKTAKNQAFISVFSGFWSTNTDNLMS